MAPGKAMLHFDRAGRAFRWSPPKGKPSPRERVAPHGFDLQRNWFFVRALLTDPEIEVQWIFIQRDLAARMLEHAGLMGEDPALLARAAFVMHQPSHSDPHDDHMHVRVFCDPHDRAYGCADRGPVRWWKKRWKYMGTPTVRSVEERNADSVVDLLRSRRAPVELLGVLTS